MGIERQQIGPTVEYRGRKLTARYMGPDLLGYVDEVELSGFFVDVKAAHDAGQRYVDAEIKAAADAEAIAMKGRRS